MVVEDWNTGLGAYYNPREDQFGDQRPRSLPISNPTSNEYQNEQMRRSGTENPPDIKNEEGKYLAYSSEQRDWAHTAPGFANGNGNDFTIGTQQQADVTTSPRWATSASAPTPTPAFSSYPTPIPNVRRYPNAGLNAVLARRAGLFAGPNQTRPTAPQPQPLATRPVNPGSQRGQNLQPQLATPQYRIHYEAPRHTPRRDSNIAAFVPNFAPQQSYYSNATMSMIYEDQERAFSGYPQSSMMHDPNQEHDDSIPDHRYPDPSTAMAEMTPYNTQALDASAGLAIDELPELPKEEDDAASPGRSKPIPKPDREVTKGEDGRFVCTWPGCSEDMRAFSRKCEWSKHMDKHDRPYKCPAEGCEKLPGFTYAGGLLRHQREVHHLHGGPRKQLNCPYTNCKRFSGKGFSRQENLNEHLRRVHTEAGDAQNGEETEEDGSERAGMKRKRSGVQDEQADMRQEMARLRQENEELRRTSETIMRQLQSLQALVGAGMQQNRAHQAPQAPMM